jgi:20S proteasome subunit beta 3
MKNGMQLIEFLKQLRSLTWGNHLRFGPYFSEPLIAGLDPENFTPYICNMDHIGCISNPEDFVAVGTGGLQLYGICEAVWEKHMVG